MIRMSMRASRGKCQLRANEVNGQTGRRCAAMLPFIALLENCSRGCRAFFAPPVNRRKSLRNRKNRIARATFSFLHISLCFGPGGRQWAFRHCVQQASKVKAATFFPSTDRLPRRGNYIGCRYADTHRAISGSPSDSLSRVPQLAAFSCVVCVVCVPPPGHSGKPITDCHSADVVVLFFFFIRRFIPAHTEL